MSQSTVVKTVGGVTSKITTMSKTVTSTSQQQQIRQQQQQQQHIKQNVTNKPPHKTEIVKENHTSMKSSFNTLEKKQQNQQQDLPAPKTKPQQTRTEDACVRCNRTVYKMEEVIAEHHVWHKDCFRCKECNKQLNRHSKVDSFQIHEGVVYCKIHFKQIFGTNDTPKIKPELIIRENQPTELPDGVVRSSERQHDVGLENIQTAAVKTRFQMFEKIATTKEAPEELQRNVGVKRSATVLSKMKKFHAKGMDVGVIDDNLNKNKNKNEKEYMEDLDYDDDSIHSEDYDDEDDVDLIRAKRAQREHPVTFDNMNEIKSKFEAGIEQGREARHNERKQEIQNIRSRLFMGKQARTKEMYQNAVAGLETNSKLRNKGFNAANELDNVKAAAAKAPNIKQRFETGDVYRKSNPDKEFDDDLADGKRQDGSTTFQISNKVSERMEMLAQQHAHDQLIKSHAKVKNVEKADILNSFEFFENYNPEEHKRIESRPTPPRETVVKQISAYVEDKNKEQAGIKIDGIKIDGLKIDGVVDNAKSNYIDNVKKSEAIKKKQGIGNAVDMRSAKQIQTATKALNGKKVGGTQNKPTPAEQKSSKSSTDENHNFYDDTQSDAESEISSRKPGYMDSDLENARLAARTRDLKDLFEKWNYENNVYDTAEYNDSIPEYDEIDDSQTETNKTIRAKFEKLPYAGQRQNNTKQPKINRFLD